MTSRLSQKLYLRIWLAVVSMLLLLAAITLIALNIHVEAVRNELMANPPTLPDREVILKNAQGDVIGQAQSLPNRKLGKGLEFDVVTSTGEKINVYIPPRPRINDVSGGLGTSIGERMMRGGPDSPVRPPPPGLMDVRWLPAWARPPFSFLWLLAIVSIGIAIGAYPIAKRLTLRIELLRDGVKKFGEGDLSTRVAVRGNDEVAYLAEQFNASAARVQALVESQKSLLANASHELRSPLARIRMGIEMLGRSKNRSNEGLQEGTYSEITRSIVELDQLVEEILLASRLDAASNGHIGAAATESVDLLGIAAQECARVSANLDFPAAQAQYQVTGDAKLLTRVVRNLLENAKRYSEGEIDLQLKQVGDSVGRRQVEMRVLDQGPGVPVELRKRIFEPFFRLPGASERSGGVGLGLALVRSIVKQHGGSVQCVARTDGKAGACFIVLLPV
jgi:two-component system, OmpR family, sensor kinase